MNKYIPLTKLEKKLIRQVLNTVKFSIYDKNLLIFTYPIDGTFSEYTCIAMGHVGSDLRSKYQAFYEGNLYSQPVSLIFPKSYKRRSIMRLMLLELFLLEG